MPGAGNLTGYSLDKVQVLIDVTYISLAPLADAELLEREQSGHPWNHYRAQCSLRDLKRCPVIW